MTEVKEAKTESNSGPIRVLVADDDAVSLRMLHKALEKWGYSVVEVKTGTEAWQTLTAGDAPQMVILDWMMPGMDGVTLCRKIRTMAPGATPYIILLTARDNPEDIVSGLDAGANDYVTKPFYHAELRARIEVGARMLDLQSKLAKQVTDLEMVLSQVKQLRGLVPICMYCKKIRNDRDYWQQVETFISEHSEAEFSHGICPDCYVKLVESELE